MSEETGTIAIRTYVNATDRNQLLALVRELQSHEHSLYSRMKSPLDIDHSYIDRLKEATDEHGGEILVAATKLQQQDNDVVVGYAVVLTKVKSDNKDEIDYEYGEVTDLAVTESARRRGIGRELLRRCEEIVQDAGGKYLRTEVLAKNRGAVAAYEKFGFEGHLLSMEKTLK